VRSDQLNDTPPKPKTNLVPRLKVVSNSSRTTNRCKSTHLEEIGPSGAGNLESHFRELLTRKGGWKGKGEKVEEEEI
jgi:hypothetical protein